MKKWKWAPLLLTAAMIIMLTTCDSFDFGIKDNVGLTWKGESVVHHHDTSPKTLHYPVGENYFYEGGVTPYDSNGTGSRVNTYFLDTGEAQRDIFIPIKGLVDRMYSNGSAYGSNITDRTGNDPSARLLTNQPNNGEAILILCEEILVLHSDWTTWGVTETYEGDAGAIRIQYGKHLNRELTPTTITRYVKVDRQVEHQLRPTFASGVWFVNIWGLENWLPCHIKSEFAEGRPSPVNDYPVEAPDFAYVTILATHEPEAASTLSSPDGVTMDNMNDQPKSFYSTRRAIEIANNILFYQRVSGGWYKNTDMVNNSDMYSVNEGETIDYFQNNYSTLDNDSTHVQLQYLGKIISVGNDDPKYLASFFRGLAFVLRVQYPSGGWPQYAEPLRNGYWSYVTFNDDAMTETMKLLEDIYQREWHMSFVYKDPDVFAAVIDARNKGIECILRSQHRTTGYGPSGNAGGELTVWGQQHDPTTLAVLGGRAYELPSLVSVESSTVVAYLMSLPNPGDRVVLAIESAMSWFRKTAMVGYHTERVYDQKYLRGSVRELFYTGSSSDKCWARFYDLQTGLDPLFVARDGLKRWHFREIPELNRQGYQFIGNRPTMLFDMYNEWKTRSPDTRYPLDNGMPEMKWDDMPADLEVDRQNKLNWAQVEAAGGIK